PYAATVENYGWYLKNYRSIESYALFLTYKDKSFIIARDGKKEKKTEPEMTKEEKETQDKIRTQFLDSGVRQIELIVDAFD
ncbi:MAG TPA: hypothetical protein DF383_13190, partial [Deltaproteobacteria bacterium]|nr:hypothetical protein [Deltaproteobacteria bacterium]